MFLITILLLQPESVKGQCRQNFIEDNNVCVCRLKLSSDGNQCVTSCEQINELEMFGNCVVVVQKQLSQCSQDSECIAYNNQICSGGQCICDYNNGYVYDSEKPNQCTNCWEAKQFIYFGICLSCKSPFSFSDLIKKCACDESNGLVNNPLDATKCISCWQANQTIVDHMCQNCGSGQIWDSSLNSCICDESHGYVKDLNSVCKSCWSLNQTIIAHTCQPCSQTQIWQVSSNTCICDQQKGYLLLGFGGCISCWDYQMVIANSQCSYCYNQIQNSVFSSKLNDCVCAPGYYFCFFVVWVGFGGFGFCFLFCVVFLCWLGQFNNLNCLKIEENTKKNKSITVAIAVPIAVVLVVIVVSIVIIKMKKAHKKMNSKDQIIVQENVQVAIPEIIIAENEVETEIHQ
ncbi:Ricin_B [Hexamita inflata]|uniref:Lectin domain n=1 Tax=Hexamita inflata TaxID=28002 RepID=A0AA86U1G1_9EUKA|nr:Ricin B [Hexamita inflata]